MPAGGWIHREPSRVLRWGLRGEGDDGGSGRNSPGRARISAKCPHPAGARPWLQWRREVELLSDVAYFVLTTLSGNLLCHLAFVSISPNI